MGFLLLGGAVVVVVVIMALKTIAHASQPVYQLPAIAVVTVCAASVLAICGAIGMVLARDPAVALLSALATLLFLVGVLAILSIGILLLIAAVTILVVLIRRARPKADRAAVLSGVILSFGLTPLLIVSLTPPTVECSDSGVRTSSREWWGGSRAGSTSGFGTSGPDNTASGTITVGSHNFSFTCSDGRLATFAKE